jgi:hypothetical protein
MQAADHHHTAARGLHLFHRVIYSSGLMLFYAADSMLDRVITVPQCVHSTSHKSSNCATLHRARKTRHRTEQPQLHTGEY